MAPNCKAVRTNIQAKIWGIQEGGMYIGIDSYEPGGSYGNETGQKCSEIWSPRRLSSHLSSPHQQSTDGGVNLCLITGK